MEKKRVNPCQICWKREAEFERDGTPVCPYCYIKVLEACYLDQITMREAIQQQKELEKIRLTNRIFHLAYQAMGLK